MQWQRAATTIELVQGDITAQQVDAIVNAANPSLMGGGGVDGAIHRRGGPAILAACKRIRERLGGPLPRGEAVVTEAGKLPARHVVHTAGPVWHGGDRDEDAVLARCYRNSLAVAVEAGARSVAFPSISTGAYGYPIDRAARVAARAIADFVDAHPEALDRVRMVLWSAADLAAYREAFTEVLGAS